MLGINKNSDFFVSRFVYKQTIHTIMIRFYFYMSEILVILRLSFRVVITKTL